MNRKALWTLFLINAAGTAYGYEWYWQQMVYTVQEHLAWLLPFVPDSPTASLFFTISLLFLIRDASSPLGAAARKCCGFLAAIGVATCVKYGIWAVAMILAGDAQGAPPGFEGWMLSASHLGMAAEAVLYARFLWLNWRGFGVAALWLFANDTLDYHLDIFPWLPDQLLPYLKLIQRFTVNLTIFSILVTVALTYFRPRKEV